MDETAGSPPLSAWLFANGWMILVGFAGLTMAVGACNKAMAASSHLKSSLSRGGQHIHSGG